MTDAGLAPAQKTKTCRDPHGCILGALGQWLDGKDRNPGQPLGGGFCSGRNGDVIGGKAM